MPAAGSIVRVDHAVNPWDEAFCAFLAEKQRRSGSRRTVEGYSRMLQHSFLVPAVSPPTRSHGKTRSPGAHGSGSPGASHLSPFVRQAPAVRPRVHRGREPLPRP